MSEKDVVENVDSPGAVSIPIASNSAKGIASFNAKDFTVNNGEVSAIWERGVPQYVGTIVGQEEGEGDLTWTIDDASLVDNRPVKIGEYIMLREDAFGFTRGEVFVITGISADENFLVITDNQSVFSLQGEVGPKGDKGDKGDRGEQGKEGAGIKDITNIDYPHGEFENVQYDNTDGIQLSAIVRFTSGEDTHDAMMDIAIPVVGKDGIVIDKAADSEKVNVKVDSSKIFNLINIGNNLSAYDRIPYLPKYGNTLPAGSTYLLYVDDGDRADIGDIPSYVSSAVGDTITGTGGVLITSTPTKPYQAANKKYVDDNSVLRQLKELTDTSADAFKTLKSGLYKITSKATSGFPNNLEEGCYTITVHHFSESECTIFVQTVNKPDCYFAYIGFVAGVNGFYKIATTDNSVTSLDGQTGALTTKTLFGTNSILGTGNIDIYKHVINFTDANRDSFFNMVVYSSKSLVVDSLTDLKTLIGDYATENVSGFVYDGASSLYYPVFKVDTEMLEVYYVHQQNGLGSVTLSDYTITDTVTTI